MTDDNQKPKLSDLHENISNEDINKIKIVTAALNIGMLLFFGICLFLYFSGDSNINPEQIDTSLNDIILMLALGLTALMIIMSKIVPDNLFKKDSTANLYLKHDRGSIESKLVGIVTTYYIIKFAMLEGAAIFGLVSLMLTVLNGAIYYYEIYWLGILPMFIMNFIFIITFPTKERVIQIINDKILSQNLG